MIHEVHYVEFESPGTLFSESSSREIEAWDVKAASKMAGEILERHGARPYGFRFLTMLEHDDIPDGQGGVFEVIPKQLRRSGRYFLGGKLLKFDNIPDTDENRILRDNMRCNNWPLVCRNSNSWTCTIQFEEDDYLLDSHGDIVWRGNDTEMMEYRREFAAMRDKYYEDLRKQYATA